MLTPQDVRSVQFEKNLRGYRTEEVDRFLDKVEEQLTQSENEAEALRKNAEEKARAMIEEQEIVRVAKARSAEMIASAEAKSKELRRVASSYVDDIMRQAEESMTAALGNIQNTHRAFSGAMPAQKAEPAPRKRAEEE